MKQRVALALATVWLTSIVGASVPSGETTTFSTSRPPGPSPDQYTPLVENPPYYSQDDYNQDWMNDEQASRMKLANREKKYEEKKKTAFVNLERSLVGFESQSNEFSEDPAAKSYNLQSNDMKIENKELDKNVMRLSTSIKLAFDDPIDTELLENNNEEYLMNGDNFEEEEEEKIKEEEEEIMQQDGFVSNDGFEDEGPGSVEVYKLDLYKDKIIPNAKSLRKNYIKTSKSKMPKKVETIDEIILKSKTEEEKLPKTILKLDKIYPNEFPSSRSFKDRIFGVGGVPELQVGCEGVEGPSQRQKRSESSSSSLSDQSVENINVGQSLHGSPVYIETDYDSEEDEELEMIGGTDELFKILALGNMTESISKNENRGDQDPRMQTPLDLIQRKDKLPTRGDLGPSNDPNIINSTRPEEFVNSNKNENREEINSGRKLLSFDNQMLENKVRRNKRNLNDWGYPETWENVKNQRKRRGGGGGVDSRQGHRNNIDEKRRRRHEKERENERKRNVIKKNKNGEINEEKKNNKRENRRFKMIRKNEKQRIIIDDDENEKKLQAYRRKITPIKRNRNNNYYNQRKRKQQQQERKNNSDRLQNLRNHEIQEINNNNNHVENYYRLEEQKRRETEHVNKTSYEQQQQQQQQRRQQQSIERSKNEKKYIKEYEARSPEEIARLKALPVSAYILINKEKSTTSKIPTIENRFGEDKDVSYLGLNPSTDGLKAPGFPSQATTKAPIEGPSPCVWAIMTCCSNPNRLASCFEAKGCSHGYWDNPCSQKNILAALKMVQEDGETGRRVERNAYSMFRKLFGFKRKL